MLAILGSGFGLYGYLPALVGGCAQRIVLPERYRARFCERTELERFAGDVQWEQDESAALDCADGAVLALRPTDQMEWIPRCLARSNIERLLLEKPLAHSPEVAATLFDDLIRARKVFRIGYIFRYTDWGKSILHTLASTRGGGLLSIHWNFMAHHFHHDSRSWKRFNATGGGAVRFYGIHVIALLAEIGYRDVTFSQACGPSADEVEKWSASFTGSGLPECEVVVDTRSSANKFRVEQISSPSAGACVTVFADLSDPFESGGEAYEPGRIDQRVPILGQLCHSLWEEGANEYEWYEATIKIWSRVEEKTRFVRAGAQANLARPHLR